MAMKLVEGQVALGDYLWFIPSPAKSDKCLVIAHGGKLHGDTTFKAEMTIKFAVRAGLKLKTSAKTALMGQSFNQETVRPGGDCTDYSLAKFIGHPDKSDYVSLLQIMKDRMRSSNGDCPNVVTIRNRSFLKGYSKLIKLSEVQALVKQHDSEITTLLVNACRGENDSQLKLMTATIFGV